MSNLATLAIYVLRTTNYVIADLVYSRGDYFVVAAIAISAQGPLEYYRLAQPWRRTLTYPNTVRLVIRRHGTLSLTD